MMAEQSLYRYGIEIWGLGVLLVIMEVPWRDKKVAE